MITATTAIIQDRRKKTKDDTYAIKQIGIKYLLYLRTPRGAPELHREINGYVNCNSLRIK